MEAFFFLLFAALSVFSAVMVILQKSPIASVLFLVLTLFCLAALFVLLAAPFIAAIQLIIYAGAVMVLFTFVVMLLNVRAIEEGGAAGLKITGAAVALLFLVLTIVVLYRFVLPEQSGFLQTPPPAIGSVESVGTALFTVYLLPLEIASFLLLAGIIGAVVLARRR